jgi:hypothetical protein
MELSIGRTIHVDEAHGVIAKGVCHTAVVGGRLAESFWVTILTFAAGWSMPVWVGDVSWHDPKQCPQNKT